MGQAKRKRELSEAQRRAEKERRREELALLNAPKGRRSFPPVEVRLPRDGGDGHDVYLAHQDGSVYLRGGRKVIDPDVLAAVANQLRENVETLAGRPTRRSAPSVINPSKEVR